MVGSIPDRGGAMPRPSRRAAVLGAPRPRFYRDGITATGVDALTADAGTAKMTLYAHFGSKDELVVAYLEARDQRFLEQLEAELGVRTDPLERALTVVDLYERSLDEAGFRGCAFINAAAELPGDHPGRRVIARHKARVLERWTELIADLGLRAPSRVARECYYLLEGAFVQAGLGVDTDRLATARGFIRERLAAAVDVRP
jgi:AcrR family transcriptional regulator